MEGFLLSALFLLFHARVLLRHPAVAWRFVAGLAPFALFWLLLWQAGVPASPLWIPASVIATHMCDGARWAGVWQLYGAVLVKEHFRLLVLLLAALVFRKSVSRPGIALIVTAMAAYLLLYALLVTTDLRWNITTSLPRLLLQLYPALVWLVARALAASARNFALLCPFRSK